MALTSSLCRGHVAPDGGEMHAPVVRKHSRKALPRRLGIPSCLAVDLPCFGGLLPHYPAQLSLLQAIA